MKAKKLPNKSRTILLPEESDLGKRAKVIDREESVAADIVARAEKRAASKRSRADLEKRKKVTPPHKRMHAVNNENVHVLNSSARQVDERSEIDRESERPTAWTRPNQLTAPAPRPGYVQRWVRYRSGGSEDTENLDAALDQGWRPRLAESVRRGHELTADTKSKYSRYYVKRGLILMEMPEELAEQRDRTYRRKAMRMTESIDRNMFKISHPAMPWQKPLRQTRVEQRARRGRLEDLVSGDD